MWFHVSVRYQEECDFKMYTKCSSLSDPLNNGAHKHPLTLLDSGEIFSNAASI